VNYSEEYELRERQHGGVWVTLDSYSEQQDAVDEMNRLYAGGPGVWHVVRVSEVTVATAAKG
jgi:hypothetical protein